jgi:hypothetical protein
MTTTVRAHFDGKHSLVLDEPVDLPIGTPLRVHVETVNDVSSHPAEASPGSTAPTPVKWQPLNIQIDPSLSNAIALDPEFNIEES